MVQTAREIPAPAVTTTRTTGVTATPLTAPISAAPVTGDGPLADLFRQTQSSLLALQQMQEQTARLHAQYLQGQETATRAFQQLVEQQERLFAQMADGTPSLPGVTGSLPLHTTREITPATAVPHHATETTSASVPEHRGVDLAEILLQVVSEKTGYPREMLEPGMVLDADLGIDSIKRVEILSALQERVPQLPELAAEELGGIQTLADIVKLLGAKGGARTVAPAAPAGGGRVEPILLEIVAEKTGYPQEMLRSEERRVGKECTL